MKNHNVHRCLGIKLLNTDIYNKNNGVPPIWCSDGENYSFACCDISFCPACGAPLNESSQYKIIYKSESFCCGSLESYVTTPF